MTFPLRHSVTRKPYTGSTKDALGNTVPTFGAAVSMAVFAIAPHVYEQGTDSMVESEIAELDVFAPKVTVNVKDRFTVGGEDYEVVAVKDWTQGFHGWEPGIVIELRRP